MDRSKQRDDALAQPTRARLFDLLVEARRPTGTDELARALTLHPNGIRVHLERLRDAGLVEREQLRQPRGRPRDVWSVAPGARPGGDPPSAYADVARWLTRAIPPTKASLRRVEEGAASPEASMHAALAALGFQPRRDADPPAELTYTLGNCPYRDAVRENQAVVCTLHRGMTRGLLDRLAPETKLAGFVPKNPDTAGCLIELRGGLAAAEEDG
jgi:predicted ArsR family transcriptional regulator